MLPILFCAALIAIDQLSKYLAYTLLKPVGSLAIIEGVFSLTYVENQGAAFGLFQGARWFFIVITILIMGGIVYFYRGLPRERAYGKARFTLLLIASGALGNFIDRFRQGYVVDFFHASFIDFPVFNIADSCVVIGTILFIILYLFVYKAGETSKNQEEPEGL
ncbi:MAG: signal peptidase II [Clostridiales bacterium]|jgi:signal peptidase II|nr:signal peptidase II [Clostridiales bacterium]